MERDSSSIADDVVWDNSGVASKACPCNGKFNGKAKVPRFFEAVGDNLDFSKGVFEPRTFVEFGNTVAVVLRLESRVKKNRRLLKNDAVHIWTFNDKGLVTRYQHFNGTAAEQAAWKAWPSGHLTRRGPGNGTTPAWGVLGLVT